MRARAVWLMCSVAGTRGLSTSMSTLARRCGLLAVSRSLDDTMARCITGDAAMARLCTEIASTWTHKGLEDAMRQRESTGMRALWLRKAADEGGDSQLVLLPAGLDTAAHDRKCAAGRHVFEVDDPKVTSLKRHLVDTRGAQVERVAASVTYVEESLAGYSWPWALLKSGFDVSRPSTWLVPDLAIEDVDDEARVRMLRAPLIYAPSGSTLVVCIRTPQRDRWGLNSPSEYLGSLGYSSVKHIKVGVDGEVGVIARV